MEKLIFPVTKKEAEKAGALYSSEANKKSLFPSQLRELRKEKGVSQEAVARELGVSKSTIGLYETGDTLPDAKTLYELAKYYDVSADYLLGLSTARSKDESIQVVCDYSGLSESAAAQLNEYKIHESGKIVISLINEILNRDNPFSCNFHSFITRYVLSSVVLNENIQEGNQASYAEEIKRINSEGFQRLLRGCSSIEISVAAAKHIYKDSALLSLQQIFEIAADKSIKAAEEKRKAQ